MSLMKGIRNVFLLLALLNANKSFAQEWKQYLDSATYFNEQKNTDKAIAYYTRSKELLPKDSLVTDTYIDITTNLANLYYLGKSQYSIAELFYLNVRKIIEDKYGIDNDFYATNSNFLGQIYYNLKQNNKAEKYYLLAKLIWMRLHGKISKEYAGSCNALGILYNDSWQFEKAEEQHLEARAIREQLFTKENGSYAQSCNNLAAIYWTLGQLEKAEPLALEAKEIRGRVADVPKSSYAISCVNLANIYRDMGKYQQAEALYIEAKNIREIYFTKEHDNYALSCDILADLYFLMKQYDKAEPLYLEAKYIRQKISPVKTFFYGQSCSSLSVLYREMGKYDKAEMLAKEADSIWQKLGTAANADIAINYNNLGTIYSLLNKYGEAEEFYLKANDIWKKNFDKDHPYLIANAEEMAKLYWNTNELDKASDLMEQAFQSKYKQLNKIFQFTSENEKQLYLKNINGSSDQYQSFYYSNYDHQKAALPFTISLLNRNLILSSTQQTRQLIYNSGDESLQKKYTEWIHLKQQLAQLYSKGAEANAIQLKLLEEQSDKNEKVLSKNSSLFKKLWTQVNWQDIQESLKENECAIEFAEFQWYDKKRWTDSIFYVALVLRKNLKEPILVPLFEKRQLDSILNKKMAGSSQMINRNYTSPVLYNLIWQPLEKYLSDVSKIFFAPAGNLHRVAMAALRTNDNKVLSDIYQFVQLLTTASLTDDSAIQLTVSDKIILYGAVQYDADSLSLRRTAMQYIQSSLVVRSIPEDIPEGDDHRFFEVLPFSEIEIDGIAKVATEKNIQTVLYKGAEANEESVKALNGHTDPLVLHISTHGFFNPDPKKDKRYSNDNIAKVFKRSDNPLFRSGLVMAGAENTWSGKPVAGIDDGILTAYEVSNMYFPHTKLVVLSACETALGDIEGSEGVYGMQRAFKMAGVQYLVMSLWKVPDEMTSEFMQLFYKKMFDNETISNAFYKAQNEMKDKYYTEPNNWAAWILVR